MKDLTSAERLQVIGLFLVGDRHVRAIKEVEAAIAEIVGETSDPYPDRTSEQIWSDGDPEVRLNELLRLLKVDEDREAEKARAGR